MTRRIDVASRFPEDALISQIHIGDVPEGFQLL